MDTIDLSIIGELRLNKIDYIFEDIVDLRGGFIWSIGSGLLKNLGAIELVSGFGEFYLPYGSCLKLNNYIIL